MNAKDFSHFKFEYKNFNSSLNSSVFSIISVAIDETFVYPTGLTLTFTTVDNQTSDNDTIEIMSEANRTAPTMDECKVLLRKFTPRPIYSFEEKSRGYLFHVGINGRHIDELNRWGTQTRTYIAMAEPDHYSYVQNQLALIQARGDSVSVKFNDQADSVSTKWINIDGDTFFAIRELITHYESKRDELEKNQ